VADRDTEKKQTNVTRMISHKKIFKKKGIKKKIGLKIISYFF
jgi:hypothetical protein